MSTQTIETFRQRWGTYLRSDFWRDQIAGRFRRVSSASMEPVPVRLLRGQLVILEDDIVLRAVRVRQGIVWLTGTPASGDVILYPGDRFEFGNQWPFVLQALEDAEFELSGV